MSLLAGGSMAMDSRVEASPSSSVSHSVHTNCDNLPTPIKIYLHLARSIIVGSKKTDVVHAATCSWQPKSRCSKTSLL